MKPKLLSEVLRQNSPRKFAANRYNVLRDASPADSIRSDFSQRSRSMSIKRKNDSDLETQPSYSEMVSGSQNCVSEPVSQVANLDVAIATVSSLSDKLTSEISNPAIDPVLIPVLNTISEAIRGICNVQAMLHSRSVWKPVTIPSQVNSAGNAKKPRQDAGTGNFVDLGTLRAERLAQERSSQVSSEERKLERFKEQVREAEKSTLIFNLNLGSVPIMNTNTMSTRATMALSELAAKAEKKTGKIPSEDTQAALEDVLSVATGIHFFGRKTKSFQSSKDPQSGLFCTIPVKYDFKDKDDRIEAESVLRDKCKISCATPYPAILRESIRQVWDAVKVDYPDNFIRVKVDTNDMKLKVSRRPLVEKSGKKIWFDVGTTPIPLEALDVSSRTVPEGFKVRDIPRKSSRKSSVESSQMETSNSENNLVTPTLSSTPPPGSGKKSK
jgi:hypothetical protein